MKHALYIFLFGLLVSQAQTGYNTKKGFVAEGYDVVSYFENKAEEGDKKYSATFDGAKFKFISQSHLDTFLENPNKYIPQYGGYCAFAIAEKGKKVSINPKTFEIRNNKLYLFYNSWGNNTLESWIEEDTNKLIKKADQGWRTFGSKN